MDLRELDFFFSLKKFGLMKTNQGIKILFFHIYIVFKWDSSWECHSNQFSQANSLQRYIYVLKKISFFFFLLYFHYLYFITDEWKKTMTMFCYKFHNSSTSSFSKVLSNFSNSSSKYASRSIKSIKLIRDLH